MCPGLSRAQPGLGAGLPDVGHRAPTLQALAPHEADSLPHLAAREAVQPEQRFMKTVEGSGVTLLYDRVRARWLVWTLSPPRAVSSDKQPR